MSLLGLASHSVCYILLYFVLQIRNDTSQIVNENLPQIQQKSDEMRQIYSRIDKLEVSECIHSPGLKGLTLHT